LVQRAYDKTKELLTTHREDVEKVAQRLLQKEILVREDMVELLKERPFPEKWSYEDFVRGTKAEENQQENKQSEEPKEKNSKE